MYSSKSKILFIAILISVCVIVANSIFTQPVIVDAKETKLLEVLYILNNEGKYLELTEIDENRLLTYLQDQDEKLRYHLVNRGYALGDFKVIIKVLDSHGTKTILLGEEKSYSFYGIYGIGGWDGIIKNHEDVLKKVINILGCKP